MTEHYQPNVSILTPTYNRRKFLPLILHNLLHFNYPREKLEWCVLDDGEEKMFATPQDVEEFAKKISPICLTYKTLSEKKQIGNKRNMIVKQAKYKVVIMMDDDDIYMPNYIKHSLLMMKEKNKKLVGSKDMLLLFPNHNYNVSKFTGRALRQIHEATMCFTKKYFKSMGGFKKKVSHGEGSSMIDHNEKNVFSTDITQCMICVVHSENTYNKEQFTAPPLRVKRNDAIMHLLVPYIKILSSILGISFDENGEKW